MDQGSQRKLQANKLLFQKYEVNEEQYQFFINFTVLSLYSQRAFKFFSICYSTALLKRRVSSLLWNTICQHLSHAFPQSTTSFRSGASLVLRLSLTLKLSLSGSHANSSRFSSSSQGSSPSKQSTPMGCTTRTTLVREGKRPSPLKSAQKTGWWARASRQGWQLFLTPIPRLYSLWLTFSHAFSAFLTEMSILLVWRSWARKACRRGALRVQKIISLVMCLPGRRACVFAGLMMKRLGFSTRKVTSRMCVTGRKRSRRTFVSKQQNRFEVSSRKVQNFSPWTLTCAPLEKKYLPFGRSPSCREGDTSGLPFFLNAWEGRSQRSSLRTPSIFCSLQMSLMSQMLLSSTSGIGTTAAKLILLILLSPTETILWREELSTLTTLIFPMLSRAMPLRLSESGSESCYNCTLLATDIRAKLILEVLRAADILEQLSLLSRMYSHRYSFFSLSSRSSSSSRPSSSAILFPLCSSACCASLRSRSRSESTR